MIWQRSETPERFPFEGSWASTPLVLIGLGLSLVVVAGLALVFIVFSNRKRGTVDNLSTPRSSSATALLPVNT